MTGVEAVSNGVPAFKPPEARNAAATIRKKITVNVLPDCGLFSELRELIFYESPCHINHYGNWLFYSARI